jgi:hypothetical protein
MLKKFKVLFFSLICVLTLAGSSIVMAADDSASQKDLDAIVKALKGFKFEGLGYLSYQDGQKNANGTDYSQFTIKRGYLTVKKEITPWLSARITSDLSQVSDPSVTVTNADATKTTITDNFDGSYALRLKYLYAQINLPDAAFLTKPAFEVGMVHRTWIDFEEHINWYRVQDSMFLERNSIVGSADAGVTFMSLLGGTMDKDYQKEVNSSYPGRYGSVSLGIYNGGGYSAAENNTNKAVEGRITIRPLPDVIPGLQFSYIGITGKGNKATDPDWKVSSGYVSYEQKYVTLTGQYYTGTGNQGGSDTNKKKGYSAFTEIKPTNKFSIIGRYDNFDPNKDKSNDENNRTIVGVAYMIDKPHNNMVLLDYDTVSYKDPAKKDDKRLQLSLQVAF